VFKKIDPEIVRADFNDANVVMHHTRAAHELGLRAAGAIRFLPADATPLRRCHLLNDKPAGGPARMTPALRAGPQP
jgi:hypothetical protein